MHWFAVVALISLSAFFISKPLVAAEQSSSVDSYITYIENSVSDLNFWDSDESAKQKTEIEDRLVQVEANKGQSEETVSVNLEGIQTFEQEEDALSPSPDQSESKTPAAKNTKN